MARQFLSAIAVLLTLLVLAACNNAAPSSSTPTAGVSLREPDAPGALLAEAFAPAENEGQPTNGSPAPNFVVRYADGAEVNLRDLRGKVILLNFWATWCGPCRVEMPDIVNAYRERKNDNFVILSVNFEESPEKIVEFAKEFDMTFPIVIDNGDISRLYQVRAMPTSFFIDKAGNIHARWMGILTPELLEKTITPLLAAS